MQKKIIIFIVFIFIAIITLYFLPKFLDDGYNKFLKLNEEINVANNLFENKKYDESINKIDNLSKELYGNQYYSYIELIRAKDLYKLNDYKNSLISLNKFEIFLKAYNKKIDVNQALDYDLNLYKGLALSKSEEFDKSNLYLDKSFKNPLFKNKNISEQAILQYQYAFNFFKLDKYKDAITILEPLVLNNIDSDLQIQILNLLGNIYKDKLDNNDKALYYLNRSLDIKRSPDTLFLIMEIKILDNKNEEALDISNELISVAINKQESFDKMDLLYIYQGILYYKDTKYVESLHSLLSGKKVVSESKNNQQKNYNAIIKMYTIFVYYSLKEYKLSLDLINEVNSSNDFTQEMKDIANKYKESIRKIDELSTNIINNSKIGS